MLANRVLPEVSSLNCIVEHNGVPIAEVSSPCLGDFKETVDLSNVITITTNEDNTVTIDCNNNPASEVQRALQSYYNSENNRKFTFDIDNRLLIVNEQCTQQELNAAVAYYKSQDKTNDSFNLACKNAANVDIKYSTTTQAKKERRTKLKKTKSKPSGLVSKLIAKVKQNG